MIASPRRADRRRVQVALTAAAEFGPYFALQPDATGVSPHDLYEPRRLQSLLGAVGEQIGTREPRVAASTLQYGLAARCWSLVLGGWRCGGLVLDLTGLRYVVTGSASLSLALSDVAAWDCAALDGDEVAELVVDTVVARPLTGLHTALRTVTHVADGLLWGNAASALASAALVVAAAKPSEDFSAVAAAILARPPLADRFVGTPDGAVRRRSCCLWYRTSDRQCCGDCPLSGRAVTR